MIYNLKANDFIQTEDKIKVLKVWVDPEFQKEQERLGNVIKRNTDPVLRTKKARIKFMNNDVEVQFNPDNIKNEERLIKVINSTLTQMETVKNEILEQIAIQLLNIKNSNWLNDVEDQFTIDDIYENIGSLYCIEFNSYTHSVLWIKNQLFDGHEIEVRFNKAQIREITVSG